MDVKVKFDEINVQEETKQTDVKVTFNDMNVQDETEQTLVKVLMLKGDKGDPGEGSGTTDYNDLINKPTKLSDFTNDGVFVTNTTNDLVNYYTKSEAATTALYTATLLSSDWEEATGTTVPYYAQIVDISGILATDTPIVDVVLDFSASIATAQLEAWENVSKIVTYDGYIMAFCMETMPTTDIPIQLKVVR